MAHRPFVTTNLTGSGTAAVANTPGVLDSITVSGGSVDAYDHPSKAQGRKVAGVGSGTFVIKAPFTTGLTLSVTGTAKVSVTIRTRK